MLDVLNYPAKNTKPAPAGQYRLAESDRQKILAQSPLAKRMAEIEAKRQVFIEENGHDGLNNLD